VFAAPEDWGAAELGGRARRAATELAAVIQGQIEQGIADRAWSGYRHEFAGNATRAEQTAAGRRLRLAADATRCRRPYELSNHTRAGDAGSPGRARALRHERALAWCTCEHVAKNWTAMTQFH
jgi:hypothetical protein